MASIINKAAGPLVLLIGHCVYPAIFTQISNHILLAFTRLSSTRRAGHYRHLGISRQQYQQLETLEGPL